MTTDVLVTEDILKHYGVLGMKWGRRKGEQDSTPASQDHINAQTFRQKGIHSLSNDELRQLNQRTQLETDYARLNPSNFKKGKAVVSEILLAAATVRTAYNYVNSPMGKAVRDKVTAILSKTG